MLDSLLQRLRMFVMRADVAFEPQESLRCVGWTVPGAADGEAAPDEGAVALDHGVAGLPEVPPAAVLEVLGEAGDGGAQVLRWHDALAPSPCRRYIVIAPPGANEEEPDGKRGERHEDDADAEAPWRLGDISAGLPRVVADTRDAFVPQMVNLQHVDALSFRKGCYPGQEIVARMQYLGKLKRHMRRFRVIGDAGKADERAVHVSPGDALGAEGENDAGRVVDVATTEAGTELLAVVRIGVEAAALRLHGQALEALPLPYALPEIEPPAARAR